MTDESLTRLSAAAAEACLYSYSPYSGFPVGAAVLTAEGKVYSGTNVENASYGATMCAERVAVFKAVSEGAKSIIALAVHTSAADCAFPCGMCLQVLSEFSEGDIPVLLSGKAGTKRYALSELFPHPFKEQ